MHLTDTGRRAQQLSTFCSRMAQYWDTTQFLLGEIQKLFMILGTFVHLEQPMTDLEHTAGQTNPNFVHIQAVVWMILPT
jgi:hypothetical protein